MQNRNSLFVRRWCSGHSFCCSCDSAVRFLDSENPSQRRLLLRPAPRRVHFARPWTRASKHSSLAAKRRADALHVVFFSTKHPSPARELLLCVYSRMIRSHERRALGALLSFFSRSEPASTDSWLQSGCGEARRLRLRIVVVFIHSPRHRSLLVLVLLCVPRTAAVPGRLCLARFLLD